MKHLSPALLAFVALLPASAARADEWASVVMAQCYDDLRPDGYQWEHMFVRVFYTDLGRSLLRAPDGQADGIFRLDQLAHAPFCCTINSRTVRFEMVDYMTPNYERGFCGACEVSGFRLSVDDEVIWEIPRQENAPEPIFNGTIDVDRDQARICTEHWPGPKGVGETTTVVCQTIGY